MIPACPGCGLRFEREEGAWLGSMALNIGVAEAAFGAFLVVGIVLTWPRPPWVALTIAAIAVNAAVPLLFYPFGKTIWAAMDLALHRMDRDEQDPQVMPASWMLRPRDDELPGP